MPTVEQPIKPADEESFDAVSFDLMIEMDDAEETQYEASLPCGCMMEITEATAGFTFCDDHRKLDEYKQAYLAMIESTGEQG